MWQNGRKNNVSSNHRKTNQNSPVKIIHHLFTSLQQTNELDEQVVESVQILCDEVVVLSDKLDALSDNLAVLIEQGQGSGDSQNLPNDTANGESLNETADAQN